MTLALAVTGRRRRVRRPLVIGGFILGLFALLSFFPGLFAPYDPLTFDYNALLHPPSLAHPFGTDNFGRDMLSRVIWATRIDMQIALFSTLFPLIFGTFVGALVGYVGGWTEALSEIKRRIEQASAAEFNSVLLNRYRSGQDSIGMHADDEPELGVNPVVASVSLGSVRTFVLKHRASGEKRSMALAHGSLLVMGGTCQRTWQHSARSTRRTIW